MKEMLRKLKLLFYICSAGVLLFSCNKDDDSLNNNSKSHIEKKSFDELMQTKPFSEAMGLIKEMNSSKDRTVMEDDYGFTIYDTPVNVSESDTLIAYNLLIKSDTLRKGNYFENLIINIDKATKKTKAYIIYFDLDSEITYTEHDSFYFEGKATVKPIIYNTNQSAKEDGLCYDLPIRLCSWGEGFHVATEICSEVFTIHITVCGGGDNGGGGSPYIPSNPETPYHSPNTPGGSNGGGIIISNPVPPCDGCPKVKLEDLVINEKNCDKLNKLVAATLPNGTPNPFRANLIANQSDAINNNFEKGFKLGFINPTTDSPMLSIPISPNTSDCGALDFKISFNTIGFFHSHPTDCGLSEMFSHQDVLILYKILLQHNNGNPTYDNGTPVDYSNFVITVAGANGTYALKLTDVEAFKNKMQSVLSSKSNLEKFSRDFNKAQNKGRYNSLGNENTNSSNNEKNMLDMIKDLCGSGISLYKAKSDFSGFDRLVYENAQVTPKPCN